MLQKSWIRIWESKELTLQLLIELISIKGENGKTLWLPLRFWRPFWLLVWVFIKWGFYFFNFFALLYVRCFPWRREWLPTPVLLPGEFHVQRSLVGSSPWSHQELDTIEQLTFSFHARCFTYIISSFFFLLTNPVKYLVLISFLKWRFLRLIRVLGSWFKVTAG